MLGIECFFVYLNLIGDVGVGVGGREIGYEVVRVGGVLLKTVRMGWGGVLLNMVRILEVVDSIYCKIWLME